MTYVLMKVLESAPSRYEKGIQLLTRGSIDAAYDFLAAHIAPEQKVLDIGCGTGALTLRAAAAGAHVVGVDINPEMLAIARAQAESRGLAAQVDLRELGVAELDGEADASYDVVMSGLCFSELSPDERRYALQQAHRLLRPAGLLLIADETPPSDWPRKLLHGLIRIPLAILTYVLTQTTTGAVSQLPELVQMAGFSIRQVHSNRLHDFTALVAEKS
ncbi:MAG: class I SAM-dependent methyltransferase [Chloroflexi bacterium]|nr:class I SAM-dependent methyltransferase [Chloroflexota bacterium]